jgi:hypothetical protein
MASAKLTPLGIAVLELLHEKPMHPYEMATLMRERYVDTRVNVKATTPWNACTAMVSSRSSTPSATAGGPNGPSTA